MPWYFRFFFVPLLLGWWTGWSHNVAAGTPMPAQFQISKLKTRFLGMTVTLSTGVFRLEGGVYRASYDTTVYPLSSENESGTVILRASEADYARLLRGEAVEIFGHAETHKGEVRQISVLSQPTDNTRGKAKVKIAYGISKLVFHGEYRTSCP